MNSINTKVVLAQLEVSGWNANKRDKTASLEVAEKHGLRKENENMARVWKSLAPKCASILAVQRVMNGVRTHHYENTLPHRLKGARILPVANYMAYTEGVRDATRRLEFAVRQLAEDFPRIQNEAKAVLGTLYKPEDYPRVEELTMIFAIRSHTEPLPDSAKLLDLGLGDEEAVRLKKQYEDDMAEMFRRAHEDLWSRLYTALKSFQQQVAAPAGPLREATLRNLKSMLPILDRLNVSGDENLRDLSRRMGDALDGIDVECLRTDAKTRRETAKAAADIFSSMSAFYQPEETSPATEPGTSVQGDILGLGRAA